MMSKKCVMMCSLAVVLCAMSPAWADVLTAGGGRLVAMQNNDGGWDWPLSDGDPKTGSARNILAPTAMGLAQAYGVNADPSYLEALKKVGASLLKKPAVEIVPEDGYLAAALDKALGGTKYADFVNGKFFQPLTDKTFPYFGEWTIRVNADWYLLNLRQMRAEQGVPNLAAFDCGIGLYAAQAVGADTKAWIAATKTALNDLDASGQYEVLGLAGAVLGLASVKEDVDPTKGAYKAAGSLADLAKALADCQLATGGFTWSSLSKAEGAGNETVQETVFALLALKAFDSTAYLDQITKAADFLKSVQLPTGGWEDFSRQGEFNLLTGEVLWALAAAEQAKAEQPKVDEPKAEEPQADPIVPTP